MRIFKPILICILFAGSLPVYAQTATHEAHHPDTDLESTGVYNGFLPCADCGGLKIILALNPNKTYTQITQYVGKSIREYTEKGKFEKSDDNKKLILTPRTGTGSQAYLIGENSLTQLDAHGNRYTSNADKYILRKLDITAKAPKHLH